MEKVFEAGLDVETTVVDVGRTALLNQVLQVDQAEVHAEPDAVGVGE